MLGSTSPSDGPPSPSDARALPVVDARDAHDAHVAPGAHDAHDAHDAHADDAGAVWPRWRLWPSDAGAQRIATIVSALLLAYIGVGTVIRFVPMFDPWSFDGDQAQAVWHYWRYAVPGAFPPGDVQTDYAFVMHAPPVWWLLMSTLTTILRSPLWAAKLLNLVSYGGTCFLLWRAVSKRSTSLVGLAAVAVMLRNNLFFQLTAGGYARSFGPFLVLLFLNAFLERKHYATLAVLVVSAAFYPSVVMPCGFAYGVYVVLAGPTMRARLVRCAGMFVAGLSIIALGLYQDLEAPAWWGKVVSVEQAMRMPAWGEGGRITEVPLRPPLNEIARQLVNAFIERGFGALPHWNDFINWHHGAPIVIGVALGVIATLAVRALKKKRGEAFVDAVPWELFVVFIGTMISYFVARQMAFKLYFPYRVLAHVIPYLFYFAIPTFAWSMFRNLLRPIPGRFHDATLRASVFAVCASVLPMLLACGTGFEIPLSTYGSMWPTRGFYQQVREKLPIDATIAGQIGMLDVVPLFTWHRTYVMRDLAHPFRPGYYGEEERRIRISYDILYSTDLQRIVNLAHREHITHLMYDTGAFANLDPSLFEPVKRAYAKVFEQHRAEGFALERVPASAIVIADDTRRVVDIDKLAAAIAHPSAPAEGSNGAP